MSSFLCILAITFIGFIVNPDGTTTWRYSVEAGDKDVSHVEFIIPACVNVVDATPDGWIIETGPGNEDYRRIKWDSPDHPAGSSIVYTITTQDSVQGSIEYTVKAGQEKITGDIEGPACNPTAVEAEVIHHNTVPIYIAKYTVRADRRIENIELQTNCFITEAGELVDGKLVIWGQYSFLSWDNTTAYWHPDSNEVDIYILTRKARRFSDGVILVNHKPFTTKVPLCNDELSSKDTPPPIHMKSNE